MIARQRPTSTSRTGKARIIVREGVRLVAYPDPATHGEPYTIGVGHTGGVRPGDRITMRRVFELLAADLKPVEAKLQALRLPDQGMFDACASIGINLGPGIFDTTHDLGRELHARRWATAADAILEYDVAGGRHMLALADRRKSERRQFLRGLSAFRRRQNQPKENR